MGGQLPPQPSFIQEVEAFQLANLSTDARGKQKSACEVAEAKKDLRKSERREKRVRVSLGVKAEDVETSIQATSDENGLSSTQGAGRVNATKCRTAAGGETPHCQVQVSHEHITTPPQFCLYNPPKH